MPSSIRSPHVPRPAALALLAVAVAVLLAACTSSGPAPPSRGSPSASATSASATSPPGSSVPPAASPTHKPPGPFRFRLEGVNPSPTGKLRHDKARRTAHLAAQRIRDRFDSLFRTTFVDARSWRPGSYGKALTQSFGGHVLPVARRHLKALSLGLAAGRRFERVMGASGHMKVNVLIGPKATVVTASVHAVFQERAIAKNGRTTIIVSDGHYFVRPGKRGWVIDAFSVRRHDHRPPG
ncbi:MAG: hypothetical protein ACJ77A_05185 [Actinomycetota bacterium]